MSENYKTIRRARDAVRELKAEGWGQTKIAKHIGVSNAMIVDLLTLDEVAQDLREPTLIKFRKFLDTRSAAKQHFKDESDKSEQTSQATNIELLTADVTQDMLDDLSGLASRFAKKGFRLDCALTMIHPIT